ncbi:RNA polymerase sigma-70 factor [Parapedobacter sp. ISTM3]|uniref:RNA polymerase sigma-70 factor n=1 Tax=Parapedobacter TaxID=416949 RepID=UPI0009A8F7F7|nr:RNA polymerase sigma-70 factor [Parapedobacter luteus]MBK1440207.1 RNA polymerase sigma-70 factor [Parapedobacter sp. ISTM3]
MSTDYNYTDYNDDELVMLLKQSKQKALVAIYNRYWDKLFVVAANLLGSAEEAEECVQNVFVGLWNRRETIQLSHTLNTYLSVAVKYQSLSAMARNQRRQEVVHQEEWTDPMEAVSPESAFIAKELRQRIEQSINRLPPQCQLVFRMSREQDMSVKAIAEALNLSENTVKMHLKNANKKLRNDLLAFLPLMLALIAGRGL